MNICKLLPIAVLLIASAGLELSGRAQANLVDLNNFTGETQHGASASQGISVGFNSVLLYSGWGINGPGALPDSLFVPILAGNISTTPGATYEISYTVSHSQQLWFAGFHPVVSFGASSFDASSVLFPPSNPGNYPASDVSVNVDYTYVATLGVTAMTFYGNFGDNADSVWFSNISVTAVPQSIVNPVPESSPASLLGLGGCVWLLAALWRRSISHRK